jgi:hypothetical protein
MCQCWTMITVMKVQVTGYVSDQFMPISFIKLIQEATREAFGPAKHRLDRLAAGHIIEINFQTREAAEAFILAASNIGANASIPTR